MGLLVKRALSHLPSKLGGKHVPTNATPIENPSGRFIGVWGPTKTFKQAVFVLERLLHQKNIKTFFQKNQKN